jgi:hypothetical protein
MKGISFRSHYEGGNGMLMQLNVMNNNCSFASPTTIWREPWRMDPSPSAQKDGGIFFLEVIILFFVGTNHSTSCNELDVYSIKQSRTDIYVMPMEPIWLLIFSMQNVYRNWRQLWTVGWMMHWASCSI